MSVARDTDTLLRAAARLEAKEYVGRLARYPEENPEALNTAAWLRAAAAKWRWVPDREALMFARQYLAETA